MNNKFSDAPAWSLGIRHRNKSHIKIKGIVPPGPGTYNLRLPITQTGCKIGTSTRTNTNLQNQPGPGNYDITSKSNAPKITIANRFIPNRFSTRMFTPGPANYDPSSKIISRSTVGVTMGAKYDFTNSKQLNDDPGPGTYNLGNSLKSGVRIGTAKRTDFILKFQNPGPANYSFDKRPFTAGPKYGFGRATRKTQQDRTAPGPGQYNIGIFPHGDNIPGCTIGQRHKTESLSNKDSPGPGTYTITQNRHLTGIKMPKNQKKLDNTSTSPSPGPGSYNLNTKSMLGIKIGKSSRVDFNRRQTPGPSTYDPIKDNKIRGVIISGCRNKNKVQDFPGPGTYHLEECNRGRPCSANIGRALRTQGHRQDTPGPGKYYQIDFTKYKFAYTKQLRSKQLKKIQPGPGQYNIPITVPSAPHYLIDPSVYQLS